MIDKDQAMEDIMKKRNANVWIKEGTEVHGPDGWVKLLGDCTVKANLDPSGFDWLYQVAGEDFYVPASEVIVL